MAVAGLGAAADRSPCGAAARPGKARSSDDCDGLPRRPHDATGRCRPRGPAARPGPFRAIRNIGGDRASLLAWLECRSGAVDDFVFPSRIDQTDHISTRQYARLVDEWETGIGLRSEGYGTRSLRRTKTSIIYKQTGNLRPVQNLLGHTKIESTVHHLGVDIEDALALAERTEVKQDLGLIDGVGRRGAQSAAARRARPWP